MGSLQHVAPEHTPDTAMTAGDLVGLLDAAALPASSNVVGLLDAMMTLKPALAHWIARARPTPCDPPVICRRSKWGGSAVKHPKILCQQKCVHI